MLKDKPMNERLAVVTGGNRGLGLHIARALAQSGATVALTSRDAGRARDAAATLGQRCHGFALDQRDRASVDAFASAVLDRLGTPDILVNNAAITASGARGLVTEIDPAHFEDLLRSNLLGVFLVTRAFLPAMIARERGDIFMISSMSGKKGDPGTSAYNAGKFGLQGFSQSLMYEVRRHNIRVMVLNPSTIDTGTDDGVDFGKGAYLHAADLAATIVHMAALPGRTMIRDMDIFGTNP